VESERDPGEQPDFGVGRFDQSLGETVVEVGVGGLAVSGDLLGEFDKRWEFVIGVPRSTICRVLLCLRPL
jgi:hypothetical protein